MKGEEAVINLIIVIYILNQKIKKPERSYCVQGNIRPDFLQLSILLRTGKLQFQIVKHNFAWVYSRRGEIV